MPVVTRSSVWQASPYCPPESRTQLSVLSDAAVSADHSLSPLRKVHDEIKTWGY